MSESPVLLSPWTDGWVINNSYSGRVDVVIKKRKCGLGTFQRISRLEWALKGAAALTTSLTTLTQGLGVVQGAAKAFEDTEE
jgi:lipoate-protein ligase A